MSSRIPLAASLPELPLTDENAILQRLATLVQGAFRRQAWFLVLDEHRAQLPVVIPMDLPPRPDQDPGDVFRRVFETLGSLDDVAELLVIYERPGPPFATDDDLAWLLGMEDAVARATLPVHGPYFATGNGNRRWRAHPDAADPDPESRPWPRERADRAG